MAIRIGTANKDTLTGTSAIDTLFGREANDSLSGLAGNDRLVGEAGNDRMDGGTGNDRMEGGAGNDTYVVVESGDVVVEAANAGIDLVISKRTLTLGSNVEHLTLAGTAALKGTGNTLVNILTGNNGINTLLGMAGNDSLFGNGGNDRLDGGLGNDRMEGGAGNDIYVLNVGDKVTEAANAGTDTVIASGTYTLGNNVENLTLSGTGDISGAGNALRNTITGNAGANTLLGEAGNDVLKGGAGNDLLDGGTGNDTMDGGPGEDRFIVDSPGDVVIDNDGANTFQSNVSITLPANVQNVQLTGSAALNATGNALDNTITGNNGANILQGLAGNDVIAGGSGIDTIAGGAGTDALNGGSGNDAYVYNLGNGADVITDSSGTETLVARLDLIASRIVRDADDAVISIIGGGEIRAIDHFLGHAVDRVEIRVLETDLPSLLTFRTGLTDTTDADLIAGTDVSETIDNLRGFDLTTRDYIFANGGDDVISVKVLPANELLEAGFIFVNPGTGNDTITAREEIGDALQYADRTEAITFDYALGQVVLPGEVDNFTGIDSFIGGSGNDVMDASSATTFVMFRGGGGDDTFVGGASFDLMDFLLSPTGVVVDMTNGTATGEGNDLFTDIDGVNGSLKADTITGSDGSNLIAGNQGNDTIVGGLGDDVYLYRFREGSDTVTDTGGQDDLVYKSFERFDAFWFADGSDLVQQSIDGARIRFVGHYAGNALETVNQAETEDNPETTIPAYGVIAATVAGVNNGTAGNDIVVGTAGNDTIDSGTGLDRVFGGAGNDIIDVNDDSVDDYVVAGRGNDTIAGNGDILSYLDASVAAVFNMTARTVTLGSEVDSFTGMRTFVGTKLNDTFTGTSNAANVFVWEGGAGNDFFNGSLSKETIRYLYAQQGVTVDLLLGTVTGGSTVGTDTMANIDNVSGSAFADVLLGSNLANIIHGGSDSLGDLADSINGRDGDDSLFGGQGNDTIEGGNGNDLIDGGAGADKMSGGKGDDVFIVNHVDDTASESADSGTDTVRASVKFGISGNIENLELVGGDLDGSGNGSANRVTGTARNNKLEGGGGNDLLFGRGGSDELLGGAGNDQLFGEEGSDILSGGSGNDVLNGGAGGDTYIIDSDDDTIVDSEGTDTVQSSIAHTLQANMENLTLTGGGDITGTGHAGANAVIGNNGDNRLEGLAGDDALAGEGGHDTLVGGTGADVMNGGGAADFFLYEALDHGLVVALNGGYDPDDVDSINDFDNGVEEVRFLASVFDPLGHIGVDTAAVEGISFSIIGGSFDGTSAGANTNFDAGRATFVFSTPDGTLYYDSNGAADGYTVIAQMATPTAGDIAIVNG